MAFDVNKYNLAFENFISLCSEENFKGFIFHSNHDKYDELCSLLRIGKLTMHKELLSEKDFFAVDNLDETYFECDNLADDSDSLVEFTDVVPGTVSVLYTATKVNDNIPWSTEEKNSIISFIKIIYSLSTLNILGRFVGYSHVHDLRFKDIGNMNMAYAFLGAQIAKNSVSEFSIAFFNFQNFSSVNKTYGEKLGTEVMYKFYTGLKDVIQVPHKDFFDSNDNGVVCAVGGDNGICIFRNKFQNSVLSFLRSSDIVAAYNEIETHVILSNHIGLCQDLEKFHSAQEMVSSASAALNMAKKNVGGSIVIFDADFQAKTEKQHWIENIFRDAIKNEEFMVYYQPKVDLHDYSLKGAEALVRWMHEGKMIFPDQFIPVIENNFTIKYLDLYMLNHVCEDIAKWLNEGKDVPQISVNLSRASLTMANISDVIISIIDGHKVPHSLIQIELTESGSQQSNESLRPLVESLSQTEISTAIDDFGTGYSSLALINELPWDVLKIDKSILHGAHIKGSREQKMFKSIISMANDLGLKCIVEGVETRDDIRIMKESKCYLAQGYYFNKPLPKVEFEEKLDYIML